MRMKVVSWKRRLVDKVPSDLACGTINSSSRSWHRLPPFETASLETPVSTTPDCLVTLHATTHAVRRASGLKCRPRSQPRRAQPARNCLKQTSQTTNTRGKESLCMTSEIKPSRTTVCNCSTDLRLTHAPAHSFPVPSSLLHLFSLSLSLCFLSLSVILCFFQLLLSSCVSLCLLVVRSAPLYNLVSVAPPIYDTTCQLPTSRATTSAPQNFLRSSVEKAKADIHLERSSCAVPRHNASRYQ